MNTNGVTRPAAEYLLAEASCRCELAAERIIPPPWCETPFPSHCDKLYALRGGRGWIRLDGAEYALRPGRVFLFPAGTIQQGWIDPKRPLDIAWIHFDLRAWKSLPLLRLSPLPRGIGGATARRITATAEAARAEFSARRPGWALAVQARLLDAVATAFRAPARDRLSPEASTPIRTPTASSAQHVERIAASLALATADPSRRLTLRDLARAACLHPTYFDRLFKKLVGLPPMRFLEQRRLRRAQELLSGGETPVADIAAAVGYSDPYHFSRAFRRFAGCSPSVFRAEARQTGAIPSGDAFRQP